MTKLEKELQMAILDNGADYAKAAAEVAKRYIEKAFHDAYHKAEEGDCVGSGSEYIEWQNRNGVTGEVNS